MLWYTRIDCTEPLFTVALDPSSGAVEGEATVTTKNDRAGRLQQQGASSTEKMQLEEDPISKLARLAMAKVVLDSRNKVASQAAMTAMPLPHVTAMAYALADTNEELAEEMVADLLAIGLSVQDLCLDHLAPAARELGEWWENDKMPFAEVALATARIQTILRTIPASRAQTTYSGAQGALFAAVPGETHTLGVIMAADHFRRLGWDVGLLIGMESDELSRKISDDDRTLIGLSCAGRHSSKGLQVLVDDIRCRRPDMAVVVGGNIINDKATMASLSYVDGIVSCLDLAESVMQDAADAASKGDRQISMS